MPAEASSSGGDARWLRWDGSLRKFLFVIPVLLVVVFFFEMVSDSSSLDDVTPTVLPNTMSVAHNEMAIQARSYYDLESPHEFKKARVLVTGAAGFIGFHICQKLHTVGLPTIVGIDNFNSYYAVELKEDRASKLLEDTGIQVQHIDVCDEAAVHELFVKHNFTHVFHMAAQAGVRYSLEHPLEYVRANVECFVKLLEEIRKAPAKPKLIYASSSSVYGANTHTPFSEIDRTDQPVSLYAATKKENELIAHVYHKLYDVNSVGLRFFTVYGPWGRPDMAMFIFTHRIMKKQEIQVSEGNVRRDFTYVDDIVQGIVDSARLNVKYDVFNLGNHDTVALSRFVKAIENSSNMKAIIKYKPLPPGDVQATHADIERAHNAFGYSPTTSIEKGVEKFVEWYKLHNGGQYMPKIRRRLRLQDEEPMKH